MKTVIYGMVAVLGSWAAIVSPGVQAEEAEGATVQTSGGITVENAGGPGTFQLDGRLQFDTMFFDGVYNDSQDASASDTRVRRMRVGFSGDLTSDLEWEFVIDISDDKKQAKLDHGYLRYSGLSAFDVTFGKFKRPFLLETLTSSKWITFNERSLASDVSANGLADFGVMASKQYPMGESGSFSWYLDILNEGSEDYDPAEEPEGRDRNGAYGRLVWAPWAGKTDALHFGLAFGELNPAEGGTVEVESKLGANAASAVGVDYAVDSDRQTGLEAAWVQGPFSAQAEYVMRALDLTSGDSADLTAAYAQLAWTLTGESRTYKPYPARMDKVKPTGANGAVELAVRYDMAELEQPGTDAATADTMTFGVNWYVNPFLLFKLNYLKANAEDFGTAHDSGDAISVRTQLVF